MKKIFNLKNTLLSILGAFIMAFGLYEIHSFSGVTEGGVLGATLLLKHHFNVSPAFSSAILNIICYFIGWKILGKGFIFYSAIATLSFSLTYRIIEATPPLFEEIAAYPAIASVVGALFIGVGAGLCIRAGGAPSGDDSLAMAFSKKFKLKIETVYLISDLTVLALSLTYIPPKKIIFSLLTVILSGKIIGIIDRTKRN